MRDETSIRFEKNASKDFYTTGQCMVRDAHESEGGGLLASLEDSNYETYFIKQPEAAEETERTCCAPEVCYVANSTES
jgi:hypothetical protein